MSRGKTASGPKRRVSQACLPFHDESAVDVFAASSSVTLGVARCIELVADQVVERCLDPDDPDAYLDAMSNEQLRRHVDELKVSSDSAPLRS